MKKNFKKLLVLFNLFLMASCASNHYDNRILYGESNLNGGYGAERAWEDKLEFQRTSWVSGLSVLYDAFIVDLDNDSPFFTWLSSSNQKAIKSDCNQFLVSIIYSDSPLLISHVQFINEIRKNGFSDYIIPTFSSNVKSHPDFVKLHIQNAKIIGFCKKAGEKVSGISLGLLNFPKAVIQL